jgi:hypothetical protein
MNAIGRLLLRALIVLCCMLIYSLGLMDTDCKSRGGTPTRDHSCFHKAQ